MRRGRSSLRIPGIVLAALVLLETLPARAAAVPQYIVHTWQTEDGLPDNRVTAVVQTQDGYLWFGTLGGLARFDGVRFRIFDASQTQGLLTSPVTSLFEDSRRVLWIGYETGELVRHDPGHGFQSVPIPGSWTNRKILGIRADEAGDIWLMNAVGLLMRVRDGLVLDPRRGYTTGPLVSLASGSDNLLWVARNGAASMLRHGALEPHVFEGLAQGEYVQGICESQDIGLWVVNNGRIGKWKNQQWSEDRGATPWGSTPIVQMIETKAGVLAAATSQNGLFLVFPNREFAQFNRTNGFPSDWVRSLCEDREGNIWAGTGSRGVVMLRPGNIETLSPPDRWQGSAILSVCSTRDGALWAGTDGAGLYRYKTGEWTHYGYQDGLPNSFVWSVSEDAQGQVWAGTWGGGLIALRGTRFEQQPGLGTLIVPTPAVLHSRDGSMWVGTTAGLLHSAGTQTNWYGLEEGLVLADVRAIIEDRDGTIWFGMFGGGLGCLKNGKVQQFRKQPGLASDLVQCLRLDSNGALWLGTFGGGLSRFFQGRFSNISLNQGLANNIIFHIQDDGLGYLWMSSRKGILRVSNDELNGCADGRIQLVKCQTYGTSEGLPTLECSGGGQPAGCRASDGRLWFPTSKGLVGVNPSFIQTNTLRPPVIIEKVLLDDKDSAFLDHAGAPVKIPPGRHRLEFQYTSLSFVAPDKVQFRYQLEGFEPQRVEAWTRRSAIYSYIPPGDYIFRVTACNNDGLWNDEGASIAVIVLPQFWQTWWFRALVGILMVGAGGAIMWLDARRRMRRKLERIERQQAIEHERARIAKDIHDDLGASLTRITLLSESERSGLVLPQAVTADLDQIRKTAIQLTTAMGEVVWAINPQNDSLDSLTTYLEKFGQEFLRTAGVLCQLEMPLDPPAWPLTSEVRHNLFLAFKEALNNIVKHAKASEARIVLALEADAFRIVIQDNGGGFEIGERSADAKGAASGNGLRNMRHRLEEIGGQCRIQSAPGKGTTIELIVPASIAAAGP